MGETPDSGQEKLEEKLKTSVAWKYYKYPEYDAAVELVRMLRGMGVIMHVKHCPKCGAEGSISVIRHASGYNYVVIRHPDRRTHIVPRNQLGEVMKELCEIKKDLEYILDRYKKYEERGIKFCAEEGQ